MLICKRPLLTLLSLSLLVHGAVLVICAARTGGLDRQAFKSADAREYYQIARNLCAAGEFSQCTAAPFRPDTWRTVGYPLFLCGAMMLVGKSPAMLIIAQQILAVVNVLLLGRIALANMSSGRAVCVGVLFLLAPYHQLYALWLMPTTLFVTALLLTWLAWQWALESRRARAFAVVGLLAGTALLVWPVGVLLPAVMTAGLAWAGLRRRWSSRTVFAAATCCLTAAMLMPALWMGRNALVAGRFALSHQPGVVLAYFKATEVVLWRQGRTADRYDETALDVRKRQHPHVVWEDIDTRLRNHFADLPEAHLSRLQWANLAQGNKTAVDSWEISSALWSIGREMLLDDLPSTLMCCLIRSAGILIFPLNGVLHPLVASTPLGLAKSLLVGGAYLALVIAVMIRLLRGGLTVSQVYVPIATTLALLMAATPQLDPRFRVPMVPFLVFLACLPRDPEVLPPPRQDAQIG